MFEFIKKELAKKLSGENICLVKVRGGARHKALFFAFLNNEALPRLCVKVPSFANQNHLIESEFKNMQNAREILSQELRDSVSTPLFMLELGERRASVEETVNAKRANFDSKGGDIEKIFGWLRVFHKSGAAGKMAINGDFLAELLSKYKNAGEETKKLVLDIWGGRSIEMPLAKQHGDFHFANIYFSGDSLKVIDWSNYGKINLFAYDAVFFLRRQKKGIASGKKFLENYFGYFSVPKDIIEPWVKILEIIDDLEKTEKYE